MYRSIYLCILLLLCSHLASAQNWQCVQAGRKVYFTNADGYLRGMRIDSTWTDGADQIFVPFHTLRGAFHRIRPLDPLDSNGGSWLGSRIIARADGETLFLNGAQDTVFIRTLANTGDSWVFYNDTSQYYYQATVASADTLTISSTVDSVKTMLLQKYDANGPVQGDSLNRYSLLLSKSHGLIRAFDFYTFPYRQDPANLAMDYFAHTVNRNNLSAFINLFTKVDFQNPLNEDLYHFAVGDEYQYRTDKFGLPGTRKITIVSRQDAGSQINYQVTEKTVSYEPATTRYVTTSQSTNSGILKGMALLVDTALMPEEYGSRYFYYWQPQDTQWCLRAPLITRVSNHISNNVINNFEPCGVTESYKVGRGRVGYSYCYDPAPGAQASERLNYVKTGAAICGAYDPLSIGEPGLTSPVRIHPMPAHTELFIERADAGAVQLTLANLQGQALRSLKGTAKTLQFNVSGLPPGMYLLTIRSADASQSQLVVVD